MKSSSSLSDENEEEYEYEVEEMDEDENEDYYDEDENEDYYDEDENEDMNEHEEMEEEEEENSSSSTSTVRVEETSSSTVEFKKKFKPTKNKKKYETKKKLKNLSTSSSNDDSSYHFNDRFYSPRGNDDDSSGGNYYSAEGNTKEHLDRFFGVEQSRKKKTRAYANWQNTDDSFDPVDEIDFRSIKIGENGKQSSYKQTYQSMEEKRMYLRSRIRNLKRLLEKGGLDPAVEAVELKKIKRLEDKLKDLDLKLGNKTYDYEGYLEDFKDKLQAIRKMKTKHKQIVHALRQVGYERDNKGTSNDKKKNVLNQKRVYVENKIKNLGGFVSEDSEYSVGSWDSVEEDRGKEGTYFLVVDRPSGLDVPKEKERNGVVIYKPIEGEPSVRNFKGIGNLQQEIEDMIRETNKLHKLRKSRKDLKKKEKEYLDNRINQLHNRIGKLKELQNARIDPLNVAKHKRLGELYLSYFDVCDNISDAKSDKNADPKFVQQLLRRKKKIRDEIIKLEKELARSINRDEDDSTHEEIEEKWKLVDEAKERFARAPKFYSDPYTVNDMLGEAKKLEIKAEKLWNEQPHTRDNRYIVRRNIGRILNIFDDLNSLNHPRNNHSGSNMYHPNIDIENYYPWDGRYSKWSKNGFSHEENNRFHGKGRNLNDSNDRISGISFEMDDRFFRDGLPLIYDKDLREVYESYPRPKLLHYGPLTNSNGNEDLVFLFEDRMICTRVNTLHQARFHFKNEILLNTGELKVQKDAEKLDQSSFLPEYRENKRSKKQNPKNEKVVKQSSKESDKNQVQFEQELIKMEDDEEVTSVSTKKSVTQSTEQSQSEQKKKGKSSNVSKKQSKSSKRRQDSSSDSSSLSDDDFSDSDDSEEIDYHCFIVANGKKAKFFYTKSRSEMNFWIKKFQPLVDKQEKEKLLKN